MRSSDATSTPRRWSTPRSAPVATGRPPNGRWARSAWPSTGQTIQPTLLFDDAALAAARRRGAVPARSRPVDAQIVKGTDGTYTVPAQTGRSFNGTAAASAALTVVRRLDAPAEVRVPGDRDGDPARALTDVEVETAKDAAERMDGKLVVAFRGKEWKIKGAKIRKWTRLRPRRERIGPACRR